MRDLAAAGELVPVAAQLGLVVAAEADGDVVAGLVGHAGRHVGGHQREARGRLELAVHHLVLDAGGGAAPMSPNVLTVELAAEHVPVGLDRLAGVAVEADVGVQARCHRALLTFEGTPRIIPSDDAPRRRGPGIRERPRGALTEATHSRTKGPPRCTSAPPPSSPPPPLLRSARPPAAATRVRRARAPARAARASRQAGRRHPVAHRQVDRRHARRRLRRRADAAQADPEPASATRRSPSRASRASRSRAAT